MDAALEGFLEPALALGDVLLQVRLEGCMVGEGVLAFILDAEEIPPEIAVAYDVLAEGVPRLGHGLHLPERLLEAGKGHLLLHGGRQLPAAQGHQHAQGTALLHGLVEELGGPVVILREAVAPPHILIPAQATGQHTAGVPVPVGGGPLQQGEGLFAPSCPLIVVDVLESLFYLTAQCHVATRSFPLIYSQCGFPR